MANLTPKQERFAQLYVELGNASEAYRQAYESKAKPGSVHVSACRLLDEPNVSLRVQELKGEVIQRHRVTVDSLMEELEEARQLALATDAPAPAVSATMGKAKLAGLDKQIIDHTSSDGSMTPQPTQDAVLAALHRKHKD